MVIYLKVGNMPGNFITPVKKFENDLLTRKLTAKYLAY